jgi:hypothetical protein
MRGVPLLQSEINGTSETQSSHFVGILVLFERCLKLLFPLQIQKLKKY